MNDFELGGCKFPKLLTPLEVSEILGVTVQTLCVWRCTGRYNLAYVKSGRLVRYRAKDVEKFIQERIYTHTGRRLTEEFKLDRLAREKK